MTTANKAGWALSALVVLALVADGLTGLLSPETLAGAMRETGYGAGSLTPIALAAIVPALLYAWPRTAVPGAIGITGFLGGAIAAHLRIGEVGSPPQLACLLFGLATWGALALRDARVSALMLPAR